MSCIITHKGRKYSEEQFKEYFINNKNEFATSIAKNKYVIDSFKRKMEGIDFVFSQSPELASIGSKTQYLQYLSTIFKTSKVKDIVYHGSPNIFNEFSDEFKGKNTGTNRPTGIYFTPNKKIADFLYQGTSEENFDEQGFRYREKINSGKVYAVLLNFDYIKEGDNFIHEKDPIDEYDTEGLLEYDAYVAKNKEQIHMLGGKQDIQGFKEFVQEEKDDLKPFIDESNKIGDESINERLKKYEESIKIPNNVKSKVLEKIEKETEKVKEKLLSLGLKQEGNKFELITNSYATFRMKLKELENVNAIISTNKTSDFYQIIARLKNVDSTMELKKQGELPFTPIEVKQIIQEQQFLNDVADNVFEELSEEEKQILKKKIENGDYNLNCKI